MLLQEEVPRSIELTEKRGNHMKISKQGKQELRQHLLWWGSIPFSIIIVYGLRILLDGEPLGGLTGDSIYLTLMNLVIAMYTLAVTVFIFLATALMERREDYEQKTIQTMLGSRTKRLVWLSLLSFSSMICCLVVERMDQCNVQIKQFVTIASIIDVCLLSLYSVSIIGYENEIIRTARNCRIKLEQRIIPKGDIDSKVTLQMLGDLSMIVERIIDNHAKEYHYANRLQILEQVISREFAKEYSDIVSYRDYLRVEYTDLDERMECAPQLWNIIDRLQKELRGRFLQGESLTGMSFIGDALFHPETKMHQIRKHNVGSEDMLAVTSDQAEGTDSSEMPGQAFKLCDTIFSNSLFVDFNLNCANMFRADMSQTRLFRVHMENTICTEAVFTESVWNNVTLSPESTFDKAVFRDTDFNGQEFCGVKQEAGQFHDEESGEFRLMLLTNASFIHANMLNCNLSYVDLRNSSLKNALLSYAKFNAVALCFADLSGATMIGVLMSHDGKYPNVFPARDFIRENHLDGENPIPGFELALHTNEDVLQLCPAFYANLEGANLTESRIIQYNWHGSRIADCNLTFSVIVSCIFDSCYGKNITFRDSKINNSYFRYAMLSTADFSYTQIDDSCFDDASLQNSLFVHMRDSKTTVHIRNCSFKGANFCGSQFQGCIFENCSFENANFSDTTMLNVLFVNCTFSEGTNFTNSYRNHVKGVPTLHDASEETGDHQAQRLPSFKDQPIKFIMKGVSKCIDQLFRK